MLGFLRNGVAVLVGLVLGYFLGNGPLAEWVTDLGNQLGVTWAAARISRGPGGTVPLLIAGYLLGQGLFLLVRGLAKKIGPMRARHTERLAAWDHSLKLCTRFGLHQYLEQCTSWASEDPTTRTQSLVLFRIHGLGALNEAKGTVETTKVLQHIAVELRAASLPDSASAFTRWKTHYFPSHKEPSTSGVPAPRCPARWSGATFALAFRELDAVQVVAIARELTNWISRELEAVSPKPGVLSLASAAAIGSPDATGRSLSKAATKAAESSDTQLLQVLCDPADVRSTLISQMTDVEHVPTTYEQRGDGILPAQPAGSGVNAWLREWGPALGCLVGAVVLPRLTGGTTAPPINLFPWPDSLTEVQIVEATGPRAVRLLRTRLPDQQTSNWKLSESFVVQGNAEDGFYAPSQVHVTVTNTSEHPYYLSTYDFTAIDTNGRKIAFDPMRMLRMAQGISGRWLSPGETCSGWMIVLRKDAPVAALQFEPDRSTRMVLTANAAVPVTVQ